MRGTMCLSRVSACGVQEGKYPYCADSTQMSANPEKTWGAKPAWGHCPEHKWLGTPSSPVSSSMLPQEGCDRTRLLSESEGDPEKSGLRPHPWPLGCTAFLLGALPPPWDPRYFALLSLMLPNFYFVIFDTTQFPQIYNLIYTYNISGLRLFYPQRINNCFY